MKIVQVCTLFALFPFFAEANPNTQKDSFEDAKDFLMSNFYIYPENRRTIYCDAVFDMNKNISKPVGFDDSQYTARSKKVEFEHVVPAQAFSYAFSEWRNGHPKCVKNGKSFKGRSCAVLVSDEYRLMYADAYNLFASIGSVNALRSNFTFQMLPSEKSDFGSCDFRVENRKAQPPEIARGVIARTYMYMDLVYPKYQMSEQNRKLFNVWDKQYPVTRAECEKGYMVQQYQGNVNPILKERCGY